MQWRVPAFEHHGQLHFSHSPDSHTAGVTGKQVEEAVQAAEKKMADRQQRLEGAIVQVSLQQLPPIAATYAWYTTQQQRRRSAGLLGSRGHIAAAP